MDKILNNFKNKKLLKQAFIHRSYLNEANESLESNERLEFLGDAVLELLVSEYLFKKFSKSPEGRLTSLRSSIVRTETLAEVAKNLNFGKKLLMSKGEEKEEGRKNTSILADVFEAFIGALYLDQGLSVVSKFLKKHLLVLIPAIIENKSYLDPKSYLQEKIQEKLKISPVYKVLKEAGPDHKKIFTVGVFVKNKKLGQGKGKNKQEAEEKAAKQALEPYQEKNFIN